MVYTNPTSAGRRRYRIFGTTSVCVCLLPISTRCIATKLSSRFELRTRRGEDCACETMNWIGAFCMRPCASWLFVLADSSMSWPPRPCVSTSRKIILHSIVPITCSKVVAACCTGRVAFLWQAADLTPPKSKPLNGLISNSALVTISARSVPTPNLVKICSAGASRQYGDLSPLSDFA